MGAYVQVGATIGASTAQGCTAGPIGCAVGAAKGAIQAAISQLAQHTARLKDAKNENAALDVIIVPFDQDLQQIADAFNNGTVDASDAITALETVDTQTYNYLHGHVGPAGTAWSVPNLGAAVNADYPATCNKACTAGCCVYNNDLRPAIFGRSNGQMGLIEAIQKGEGVVTVPKVYPPPAKYGSYGRDSYQIAIKAPPLSSVLSGTALGSVATSVEGLLGVSGQSKTVSSTPGNFKGFAILAGLFLLAVYIIARVAR